MPGDPMGFLIVLWIIAVGCSFIFGPEIRKHQDEKRNAKIDLAIDMVKDYKEYDTPDWLDKGWRNDPQRPWVCQVCGMSDEPVFKRANSIDSRSLCKWCMELKYVRLHLEKNGTRRFSKAA